jgi:LPS export ABC transporter protein LptC
MNTRLLDRLAAIVSVALLGVLALFTFYLAELTRTRTAPEPGHARAVGAPDYFVEKLALSTMNASGQPALRIQAERLKHQPADDSAAFESPMLVSLDPTQPRLTVRAAGGQITADSSQVFLEGDVLITRAGSAKQAPLQITTDALTVLPRAQRLHTDRPITLTQGGQRLSGVGMDFDQTTRVVQVGSRVQAIWTPPPARPFRGEQP